MWVTETALTTALNTAYFAESVATFAIVMGVALLLAGIGFARPDLRALKPADEREESRAQTGSTAVAPSEPRRLLPSHCSRASATPRVYRASRCTIVTRAPGGAPADERLWNRQIRDVAGLERTIVVEPDFEGLAHLPAGARKPEQAWRCFAALPPAEIPEPLARAARLAVELARGAV